MLRFGGHRTLEKLFIGQSFRFVSLSNGLYTLVLADLILLYSWFLFCHLLSDVLVWVLNLCLLKDNDMILVIG